MSERSRGFARVTARRYDSDGMSVWRVWLGGVVSVALHSATAHATCFDRVLDGRESDVDCGGECVPCALGDACRVPLDCDSGRCAEFVCEERVYEKGAPVPKGYRVEMSTTGRAMTARTIGWISLGLGYGGAYVAALTTPGEVSWLYAPVVGPWIELARRAPDDHAAKDDYLLRGAIAIDGLLQTVGAGLVIGGIALSGEQLVRDDGVLARLVVTPAPIGRDGYGLWARGAF